MIEPGPNMSALTLRLTPCCSSSPASSTRALSWRAVLCAPVVHNPAPMTLQRVVLVVAVLNLAYFGVEFTVAVAIGAVSLFADSVDFLEDAAVNLLIAVALGWSPKQRAKVGMLLAGILLV